ncbi:SO_0444 family Cu/Zn efflux transporter [bacterium]|nr:SO_0444 family Cu/Zn efflux transporter [bacterium]
MEFFLYTLWKITADMAPYLLLGLIFAGVLHVFIPKKFIHKSFGEEGLLSSIKASIFGIPLPLCSCGVIPTGIGLYREGASKSATVSFLISTPQTGVDSIFVTYSLLTLPFAIIRPIIAFITGVIGGFIVSIFFKKKNEINSENRENINKLEQKIHKIGFLQKIKNLFHYAFFDFLGDISKWLVIGIIIATVITVVIPDNFFNEKLGSYPLQMGAMLLISLPMYVCATGSVPIAAAFLMKGISPGAALVFLMAGPATNAATMTVLAKSMGKKTLAIYITTITLGALIFGFFVDYFLPLEWFQLTKNYTESCHSETPLYSTISAIILLLFIIYGWIKPHHHSHDSNDFKSEDRIKNNPKKNDKLNSIGEIKSISIDSKFSLKQQKINPISIKNSIKSSINSNSEKENSEKSNNSLKYIELNVIGMTCNHCRMSVEREISKVSGVSSVSANHKTGLVKFSGENVDISIIRKNLNEIGFDLKE